MIQNIDIAPTVQELAGPVTPEIMDGQSFIRLRQNTLRLAAGMNGEVNRAEARRAKAGWLWRNSA